MGPLPSSWIGGPWPHYNSSSTQACTELNRNTPSRSPPAFIRNPPPWRPSLLQRQCSPHTHPPPNRPPRNAKRKIPTPTTPRLFAVHPTRTFTSVSPLSLRPRPPPLRRHLAISTLSLSARSSRPRCSSTSDSLVQVSTLTFSRLRAEMSGYELKGKTYMQCERDSQDG